MNTYILKTIKRVEKTRISEGKNISMKYRDDHCSKSNETMEMGSSLFCISSKQSLWVASDKSACSNGCIM